MVHPSDNLLHNEAAEYARASLRLGHTVPEIEQRLVARGLTPADAAAVVTAVLEERARSRFGALKEQERQQRFHLLLSLAVGAVCLVLGYLFGRGYSAVRTAEWVCLPLACIWFPGAMAAATGDRPTLLRWCGWLLLLCILGYRIVLLVSH